MSDIAPPSPFLAWVSQNKKFLGAALLVVLAVLAFRGGTPSGPRRWTEQELNDRFRLEPMDSIRGQLGPPDRSMLDGQGGLKALYYDDLPVTADDGKPAKGVGFWGQGGRCYSVVVRTR